jgi:DNA-binding XRE family transcriptional regulator
MKNILKNIRTLQRTSAKELAQKTGINKDRIKAIENHRTQATINEAGKITKAVKKDFWHIFRH